MVNINMKYHILGKSDVNASVLGMGCWAYGGGDYWGAQSQRDVEAVVRQALDLGINFLTPQRCTMTEPANVPWDKRFTKSGIKR